MHPIVDILKRWVPVLTLAGFALLALSGAAFFAICAVAWLASEILGGSSTTETFAPLFAEAGLVLVPLVIGVSNGVAALLLVKGTRRASLVAAAMLFVDALVPAGAVLSGWGHPDLWGSVTNGMAFLLWLVFALASLVVGSIADRRIRNSNASSLPREQETT